MNLQDVRFPDDDHITLSVSELRSLLEDYRAALASTRITSTKLYFFGKVDVLLDIINTKKK